MEMAANKSASCVGAGNKAVEIGVGGNVAVRVDDDVRMT